MENIAVCKFCGQSFYSEATTPEQLEREAIEKCDCIDAELTRKRIRYIEKANEELHKVFAYDFSTGQERVNREDEGKDEIRLIIQQFFKFMVAFEISSVTVGINGIGKIIVKTNSDGDIKIKRQITANIEKIVR